ncbi:histidine kinase [Luteococcus peritonei]|uniref:histidine kinase n=1 Tax=Luteococcus peritonei TaxID=88874 RepID=A0ABW4RYD3_9ACTN
MTVSVRQHSAARRVWVRVVLCLAAVAFVVREFQGWGTTSPIHLVAVAMALVAALTLVLAARWTWLPLAIGLVAAWSGAPEAMGALSILSVVLTVVHLPRAGRRGLVAVVALLLGTVGTLAWPLTGGDGSAGLAGAMAAAALVPLALVAGWARRVQLRRLVSTDDELVELEASLAAVRDRERSRLVDELHQTVSARLSDIQRLLRHRPGGDDVPGRIDLLDRIDLATRAALVEMRLVMQVLVDSAGPQADDLAHSDLARAESLTAAIDQANQELTERGVAAQVPVPDDLEQLELATERALARVVREAVVPLLRSTRRPDLALVTVGLAEREAQVRVQLAEPLLLRTDALDARLELLGGRVQRRATPTGGSQLLVRLPRGENVLDAAPEPRRVPWGMVVRLVLLAVLGVINLQHITLPARLESAAMALLVVRCDLGLVAMMGWLWLAAAWPFATPGLGLAAAVLVAIQSLDARRLASYLSLAGLAQLVLRVRTEESSLLLDDLVVCLPAAALGYALLLQQQRTGAQRRRRLELEERREDMLAEVRQDLARDLHDVVAHQLSVVTLQIMGHRHSREPAELDLVLDRVQAATDQARAELSSLGRVVLTGEEVGGVLQPELVAERMAEELAAEGHPVVLELDRLDQLPVSVRRSLVRLLQEGTTNVLRHAGPGAPVLVRVRRQAGGVDFWMANRHDDSPRPPSPLSNGLGLRGLADRMELMGGSCRAGLEDDEWVLRATLPLE